MADAPDLRALSLRQLELLTGKSYKAIRGRLRDLEPCKRQGRAIHYDPRAALPLIYGERDERSQIIDLATERAKLAAEQAKAQALKNAELEGQLLHRGEVVQRWTTELVAIRNRIRAIPKQMRSLVPKFTPAMARQLLGLMDDALHELAGDSPKRKQSRPRMVRGKRRT